MEEAGRSAGVCPARGGAPRVIINPERLELELGDLVLKRTADGGYLCIGFGRGARFLDAVRNDPRLNAMIDVREEGVLEQRRDHPLWNDDGHLRRLGIALSIARAGGYDPDEARDEHGRWTQILAALSLFDEKLGTKVLGALKMLVSRLGGPVTYLDTILIPNNKSLISDGAVPDAPGITYHYDQGTGHLILTRANDDGTTSVFYSERYGLDGSFRDESGNIIGRHLGDGVILDASEIPGHKSQADDDNEPKLCPEPGEDKPGWQEHSSRSLAYQSMVTGLPPGVAVNLNGVSFDGCRQSDGVMLEAKGPGIAEFIDESGNWKPYFNGLRDLQDRIANQSHAARASNRSVEWHVAEEPVADYIRKYARENGFTNVQVFYHPIPGLR